ncbi:hypothetical protein RJ55_05886 [Drechmeria coniospora]|nr:hypothetical protein RJ55_05886 [Drechmeria coniospora]
MGHSVAAISDTTSASSSSPTSCWLPLATCLRKRRHSDIAERHLSVRAPTSHPPRPVSVPEPGASESGWREKMLRKRPSDFCHLQSVAPPARKESHLPSHSQGHVLLQQNYFQPLELSIHAPAKADSSALVPADSPRAVPKNSLACLDPWADQVHDLVRRRSQSSMSFHIPRRLVPGSTALARQEGAAVAPAKPLKHEDRFRLRTPPEIEAIKERVASAMIEMERLQKRIEHVSECQSRSAHSIVRMRPDLDPVPATIRASPPAAPSFSARLSAGCERPQTAPARREWPTIGQTRMQGSKACISSKPVPLCRDGNILHPVLPPLMTRPPLRKKKSFLCLSRMPKSLPHDDTRTGCPSSLNIDSAAPAPRSTWGLEGGPDGRRCAPLESSPTWRTENGV